MQCSLFSEDLHSVQDDAVMLVKEKIREVVSLVKEGVDCDCFVLWINSDRDKWAVQSKQIEVKIYDTCKDILRIAYQHKLALGEFINQQICQEISDLGAYYAFDEECLDDCSYIDAIKMSIPWLDLKSVEFGEKND